ncbi:MAG: DUF2007 domain-containing protein [Mangrovibacterium sp.]
MEKDFVDVYSTSDAYQAGMARDLLEANGIRSVILSHRDSVFPSLGETAVYVHEKEKEKAREILKKL